METSGGSVTSAALSCSDCSTSNREDARFCKACGASIQAPPKCPKCQVQVEGGAKFCSGCGTKLVGARPAAPKNGASKVEPAASKPKPKDLLAEEKAKLPAPKPPTSNMMGNVALFAATLIGMVALIVFMNKGKEKEMSPFQGGGGAAAVAPPPSQPPPEGGDAVPGGDPIKGQIEIEPAFAAEAGGTLFIVLRNAGMPNRGPPIAVKKIDSPSFPVHFQVGQADVMMKEMPFLGPFDIYVRLDKDGNAMTKDSGDLINESPAAGIAAGASDVSIKLDKRL